MGTGNVLSVINLMPQNQEVRNHLDTILSIAEKQGYKIKSHQPRDKDSLRRALISNCSLVYLIGHAEPEAGLQLLNGFVSWEHWHRLFAESPHPAILNCCYSLPGQMWQSPKGNNIQISGHIGLIRRSDAYEWGVDKLTDLLGNLERLPLGPRVNNRFFDFG